MQRSHRAARRARARGLTLVEVLITLVIMLILAAVAYPIAQNQISRGRRAHAIAALMNLQLAEERWRGQHASYGSLNELGHAATTPDLRYALSVEGVTSTAYTLSSRELVLPTADRSCAVLKLVANGGQTVQASGPDESVSNAEAANRRCWNQ